MIAIHENRCLNRRHRTEYCHTCSDTCPQRAIDIGALAVHIDSNRCDHCALCIADCPTEVFTWEDFSPLAFLARVRGKQTLHLQCKFMGDSVDEPGRAHIPCHGLLDDRLLTALRATGVEHIHLHGIKQCCACPSREGSNRLSETLAHASDEAHGYFPCLYRVGDDMPDTSLNNRHNAAQHAGTTIKRRDFLGSVVDRSAQVATFAVMQTMAIKPATVPVDRHQQAPALEPGEYEKKHLPQLQQLALGNIASAGISPHDCDWFHQIHPQGICDGCGICALHCPTGSLLINDSEHTITLKHQASACIGCGLCISLCPMQALRLDAVTDDRQITDEQIVTLFHCQQDHCSACGKSFSMLGGDNDICPACKNEKKFEQDFFGAGGNFQTGKPGR